MKRIVVFLLVIFAAANVQAQFTSRLGRFQVNQVRGCAPFTITIVTTNLITVGECTAGKPCLMDFQGNGTQQQNTTTFTYPTPGIFTLSVLYQSIGSDDISITVDPNIQPAFEVYTCSSSQVSIKVTDKNYDQYAINFGDGSPVVQIPFSNNQVAQHAYASNANFNISVKGMKLNAASNCNSLIKSFQSITNLPLPTITTLTALNASTLKLDFVQQTSIQYKLEIAVNSTTFQQFQTLYGVNSVTIPNLRLDDNFYCFRLSSFDPCTGQNNYSPSICSHNFDLTLLSKLNKLDWQSATLLVSGTDIFRNKAFYFGPVAGASLTYSDPDVICKTDYCYQLVTNYSWGGKSTSLEKCGKAISSVIPSTVLNASSTVDNTGVTITWTQDPLFTAVEYSILRSSNLGSFSLFNKSTSKLFLDGSYASNANYCYKINYLDPCDNKSVDSAPICPIQLQGSINSKNEVSLSWSDYLGWNLGVKNYAIEKYDQKGLLLSTTDISTNLFKEDPADLLNQIVSYRIIAKPNEIGLTLSKSNLITLTKDINLFYPTAFSPDKKGPVENEAFAVNGQFIAKLDLSIFDRWGALIFYSEKMEPWDGTQSGQPMPIASYVWTANIIDKAGRSIKRSGTVVLLRK